jgi:hypothetical protein
MKLNEDMTQRIELLLEAIRTDYQRSFVRYRENADQMDMMEEFCSSLRYEVGQKYVRILQANRVWGFVVATENDKKFPQGEILEAASYKTPSRNAGRGNLFEEYTIEWYCPQYLNGYPLDVTS